MLLGGMPPPKDNFNPLRFFLVQSWDEIARVQLTDKPSQRGCVLHQQLLQPQRLTSFLLQACVLGPAVDTPLPGHSHHSDTFHAIVRNVLLIQAQNG